MGEQISRPASSRRRGIWEKLNRWYRLRAVIPLKRSPHPPDYVARSVSVGLFWAMTPTVGIQMATVFVHWILVRRMARWNFNVVHAMAWTWVTNMFTLLPFYYLFYVTGQLALGRWDDLTGYHGFLRLWDTAFADGPGISAGVEGYLVYFEIILHGWGLALLVGCVPYAIGAAWLGYKWSYGLVVRHRAKAAARRARKAARKALETGPGLDGPDKPEALKMRAAGGTCGGSTAEG